MIFLSWPTVWIYLQSLMFAILEEKGYPNYFVTDRVHTVSLYLCSAALGFPCLNEVLHIN